MSRLKSKFGQHYLVELIGCDAAQLKFVKDVKSVFLKSARESRATVLKSYFYQFKPSGVSGVLLIAESHFSVHTWPEDRYAAVDIQTCGKMYPERAIAVMQEGFAARRVKIKVIPRGF